MFQALMPLNFSEAANNNKAIHFTFVLMGIVLLTSDTLSVHCDCNIVNITLGKQKCT